MEKKKRDKFRIEHLKVLLGTEIEILINIFWREGRGSIKNKLIFGLTESDIYDENPNL